MKSPTIILLTTIIISTFNSCVEETINYNPGLSVLETSKYSDTEVFSPQDLIIYGKWKLFDMSVGITKPQGLSFDYLEIKPFGIYGA